MNVFVGIGNLTRDPEMRYTQAGDAYTKFTIAIDSSFKGGEPLYLECTAWRKLAESVAEYLRKGHKACVQGEIRMDRWEDSDGNKRTKWFCEARNVEFLTPKGERTPAPSVTPEQSPEQGDLPF